jgi:integral membrane protein|tara:strand:+ start:86 stop:481 length:396 start_codon:yes stop_codon:yes gene_type:complete
VLVACNKDTIRLCEDFVNNFTLCCVSSLPYSIFAAKVKALDISVKTFRIISTLEAISFLVLLGIAMPLKYIWDMPEMVSVVGMAHGVLFIAYLVMAYFMKEKLNWSWGTLAIVMLCSVLPFGPFYAERKYL